MIDECLSKGTNKMKQLVILRHGKAEQDTMAKDDYDRALIDRGRTNAAAMGNYILKKAGVPGLILSSSAGRAHETAILAAQQIGYPEDEIQTDQNLYFAPARWIMNVLSKLPDDVDSCLYVGHNPGITDLINDLGVKLDNLPTSSAACFEFNVDAWSDISMERANFRWLKLAGEL
jgi:phosphohistidine phosphatase